MAWAGLEGLNRLEVVEGQGMIWETNRETATRSWEEVDTVNCCLFGYCIDPQAPFVPMASSMSLAPSLCCPRPPSPHPLLKTHCCSSLTFLGQVLLPGSQTPVLVHLALVCMG